MGMFDDIEGFLADAKKPKKKKTVDREAPGVFDDMVADLDNVDENASPEDQARYIAEILQKKFGGKAKIIRSGEDGMMIAHEQVIKRGGSHSDIYKMLEQITDKQEQMGQMMIEGFKKLGLKPHCKDSKGKTLAEGDLLIVPGGDTKKVLELGFGYVFLSHTSDHKKNDGVWFEREIKERNFYKK